MEKNEHLPAPSSVKNNPLPFYSLALIGLMLFFLIVFDNFYYFLVEDSVDALFIIPCMFLLGSACVGGVSPAAAKKLGLCLAVVVWLGLVQLFRREWDDWNTRMMGMYLVAFPFAALTRDDKKGLNILAAFYLAGSLVIACYTALLLLDSLHYYLQSFVYWQGARLYVFRHPNTTGSILLISVGFYLYFWAQVTVKWQKWLLGIGLAVLFTMLALTNSRTCIGIACILVGGAVFFALNKGGWKRFLTAAIAGVLVLVSLFFATQILWKIHNDALIAKYTAPASTGSSAAVDETNAVSQSSNQPSSQSYLIVNAATGETEIAGGGQGTLKSNLGSLNGRTAIWNACLAAVRDNKSVQLWGTSDVPQLLANNGIAAAHAHNSWLEILLQLGIPALLFALILTASAVWSSISLLLSKEQPLCRKYIALLTLCLLLNGILEPFLFSTSISFFSIEFPTLLCIGYTSHWRALEKAPGKQA